MRLKPFVVITTVVLVVAGALFASNMATKLNYRLLKQGPGVSRTGAQTIALPYFREAGVDTALDLIEEINTAGGCPGPPPPPAGGSCVAQVSRFVRENDIWAGYSGGSGPNFNLEAGDGYLVQLSTAAPGSIDVIIVGSHDPAKGLNLRAQRTVAGGATPRGGEDLSRSGLNNVVLPLNAVSTRADRLINEISDFAPCPRPHVPPPDDWCVRQVALYVTTQDIPFAYTGLSGTPFDVPPGQAVYIQVAQDILDWQPATY